MRIPENRIFRCFPVWGCLLALCFLSCRRDAALERALTFAGDNRQELEHVLLHYKDDSLKLAAARFLIENMPYHFYEEEFYTLPGGKRYRPQLTDFPTEEACKAHLDSLARAGRMPQRHRYKDIRTLDSAFLVRNIDLAFEAWRKPWAKQVPFPVFCRYILPYRISREYPSGLREEMMETFIPMLDSAGVTTPLEACSLLNARLGTVMKYKKNLLPFYPTIEETYVWGGGLCEGMCDLGLFIMRAAGIPVAMEKTLWTRMDRGHHWGAVWQDGRFHCFGPGEQLPGEHLSVLNRRGHLRPAKVYRSHFDLHSVPGGEESADDGYATWLKSPLLEDVSLEYIKDPVEVRVATDRVREFADATGQVYLCAYNYYKWEPVALGCRTDTVCLFRGVGGDNIFLVADAPTGGRLRFLTAPFYMDAHGRIRKFVPRPERVQAFTFPKRKKLLNRPYTLYYWNVETDSFSPLEYSSTADSTQSYTNIPENALLWFTVPDRIVNQRVFYLENDSVITMNLIR
ncbi:transglutaminase domain-containing protein [Bacteroides sp.]|uniref:transglutaminase domain-containing protein n=1 Tax=Bacteroides sp. TaxID=29523 RepID=UPI0023C74BBA|nr:transglutaminase domain-containing protein [Bacteroides sp.]MDE6215118.1 transglutaminase domain-containing protein [Bacteroides sp.]